MTEIKVELNDIIKEFPGRGGDAAVRAVDNISLKIYGGEFFAMLGPSGCGKTTTLRMIAGFERPNSGTIRIDGQPVQDVPPHHRPVNTVFQDYALFPHMTVLQNVAFGLKMANVPRKEAHHRAMEALEMVRLPNIARRKPRELSGGQQQRVAVARALVNQPSVLLLDEPLGALDLKLRRDMQYELKSMQADLGITFIYVTHDQEEAMTMANRIAVMDGGRVLQVGRPAEIYETPRTRFVADFIGETNFITGTLTARQGNTGTITLADGDVQATLATDDLKTGTEALLAIRPERIALRGLDAADTLPDATQLEGQIEQAYYIGTDTRYIVKTYGGATLTVRVQNTDYQHALTFKTGQPVRVLWQRENARILRQ